jgi:hypothetical protein
VLDRVFKLRKEYKEGREYVRSGSLGSLGG